MITDLVKFEASAMTVTSTNAKMGCTTVRLMTAKEFKTKRGLKGQEARKSYNDYLREHGQASTEGLAAALTRGDLLVRGFRDYRGSMAVNFIKRSAIKDPVKSIAAEAPKTAEETQAEIAKLQALLATFKK